MKNIRILFLVLFIWLTPSILLAQSGEPIKIGRGDPTFSAYTHFRYTYTEDDSGGVGTNPLVSPIDTPDTIDWERLRFILYGHLAADLTYRFEYDLTDTELKDAFFKIPRLPFYEASITLGQFKLPLSEAGLVLDTPLQQTIKGPILYEDGPVTIGDRDIGLLLRGDMLDNNAGYAIGIVNGNGINQSDDNDGKDFLFHFKVSPWKKKDRSAFKPIEFAASFMTGSVSEVGTTGSDDRERFGFTMKYQIKETELTVEYIQQILDVDGPEDITTKTWYLQLTRDFKVDFLKRQQLIRGVLCYEQYEPDSTVNNDEINAITFGGIWSINKYSRLMLNYILYDEVKDEIDNNHTLLQLEFKF